MAKVRINFENFRCYFDILIIEQKYPRSIKYIAIIRMKIYAKVRKLFGRGENFSATYLFDEGGKQIVMWTDFYSPNLVLQN